MNTPTADTAAPDNPTPATPAPVEIPAEIAALPYAEAAARLERIRNELESGRLDVDAVVDRVTTAQHLLAHCRKRVSGAKLAVQQILAAA
jgi:exodeoxyribonuclease VII small subunit